MSINSYIKLIALSCALLSTYPSIAAEGTGMPQMVIPDFMPQLVWLFIIFTILYFSMKYIALPRIAEIISNRDIKVVNDVDKAEEIKIKIDEANKEHQDIIQKTNEKIRNLVHEIHRNSIQEAEKKIEECQNNINAKIKEEKVKLQKELEDFNQNIEKISSEAAESIIEKLYYVKPDSANLKTIVSKYSESYKNE